MDSSTRFKFGDRPIRCEMTINGRRVVKLFTPRQMGMDETTIAAMEAMEDDAESERQNRQNVA